MTSHFITPFILFFLGISLSFLGCSSKKEDHQLNAPPISMDKFKQILIDIHIAEALVLKVKVPKDSLIKRKRKPIEHYYQDIFEQHGIDKEAFQNMFTYCTNNISDFDALYETLINDLTKIETQLQVQHSSSLKSTKQEKNE